MEISVKVEENLPSHELSSGLYYRMCSIKTQKMEGRKWVNHYKW
jgi:hypothetical protein